MKRFAMMAGLLILTSCAGLITTVNTQDQGTGDKQKKMFESLNIFPVIPESVLNKLSPEQIAVVLKLNAQALVGIEHLEVNINFTQTQTTEGQAEGQQSADLDATVTPGG